MFNLRRIWVLGITALLLVTACGPTAAPTPTPNIAATVEGLVDQQVAHAIAMMPTPTAYPTYTPYPTPNTDAPKLTKDVIEDLVLEIIIPCVVSDEATNEDWDTIYIGEGEWLVTAVYRDWKGIAGAPIGPRGYGRWKVQERTGQVFPYDGSARATQDSRARCFAAISKATQ